MFADTTEAKVDNTVKVLEEAGRRYWAPRRYETYYQEAITAKDYSQAVPVVVTTLEQLTQHGVGAAVWRRLGRDGEQTLTDALDNPDGDALHRRQYARAEAEDERRRAAEREAQRPVCKRCGQKFTDQRWEETTARTAWKAGDLSVCSGCHADDVAREEAAAEAARLQAAGSGARPRPGAGQAPWSVPPPRLTPHGDAAPPAGHGGRSGVDEQRPGSGFLHRAQLLPADLGMCGGDRVDGRRGVERDIDRRNRPSAGAAGMAPCPHTSAVGAQPAGAGDAVQPLVDGLPLGGPAMEALADLLQPHRVVGSGGFHDGEARTAVGTGHLHQLVVHAAGQENHQNRRVLALHLRRERRKLPDGVGSMSLGYQTRSLVHGLGQDVVLLGVHACLERLHVEGDVVDPAVLRVEVVRIVHFDSLAWYMAGGFVHLEEQRLSPGSGVSCRSAGS
ncbi:hypothetical protein [Streptomyces viridosporus]|uniref:hypothetical protein n=1 Tax=Streptomyces viridosporus TaxID=67581 RepID=UPI001FCAC10C|nr:hypothetical protein [Streptomyces viridosporus]